jgi:hypothetical protein
VLRHIANSAHGRSRRVRLAALPWLAALGGCGVAPDDGGAQREAQAVSPGCPSSSRTTQALSLVDRSLVGEPAAYQPDVTLREREAALWRSQRLRREAAWSVVGRVLSAVKVDAALVPAATAGRLPAWQSWHAKDDLTRIFRHLYPDLDPAARAAREHFSEQAIDAAWSWNDTAIADYPDWTSERLAAYARGVADATDLAGLAGIYRVAYGPAASRHWLDSYPEVLGCEARASQLAAESQPAAHAAMPTAPGLVRTCSVPSDPAPACLAGPFPDAAIIVKANWRRADTGVALPVFDTSASALERRLDASGTFSWDGADGSAEPGEDEIYTLRLPNGNAFRLAGLHVMTRELDHWFWLTLWWSPEPNEDFGADRPAGLPAPWQHYKLCAVAAFSEGDADPNGGFAEDHPSLGAALSATRALRGDSTWCSNPYIEAGAGNAASNCIGCHQHAGSGLRTQDILADTLRFPDHGRQAERRTFPSDYVFAATVGDDIAAMLRETEDHYADP